ncbi:uncharacterized protein [Nothobranchius furzeri]|uniref:uncharacterized protein n=1 Tax=Nothobranchius furzeri TaxID=105023 RepID=UPI0039046D1B
MAPVFGHATARLLFLIVFTIYAVISAQFSCGFVSAVRSYDRGSLLCIKESMEFLFYEQRKFQQTFPPPFVCSPDSPEYQLVCRAPGRKRRSRKRGCRSGVQVKQRLASLGVAAPDRPSRCLRRIPCVERRCGGGTLPPSSFRIVAPGVLHPVRSWFSDLDVLLPCSPVFTPVDQLMLSRVRWRSRDRVSCLRPILLNSAPKPLTALSCRFGLFNARSIANKSFSLNELFSSQTLDFMFFTETWQREGEYIHLNELCPAGCAVFGMPRPSRRGGGLAVVFKETFICKVLNTQAFTSFESQTIKIGSSIPFYCVLIYRPPGPATAFLKDFSDFLSSIIKLENVLILGDFNIHIDDSTSGPAVELLTMTESFNFEQHVSGPTHQKGHTLDLVFSLDLNISNLCVKDVHMSDHSCVLFDLHFNLESTPSVVIPQRRIISENTAARFIEMFDSNLFLESQDVDSLIHSLNSRCKSILDVVAPFKSNRVTRKPFSPWINDSIQNLKRLCRKTERLWKSTKLEVHRLYLKDLMLSLNELIKKSRSEYFRKLIIQNKKKTTSFI